MDQNENKSETKNDDVDEDLRAHEDDGQEEDQHNKRENGPYIGDTGLEIEWSGREM
jgi:hypothetical protein